MSTLLKLVRFVLLSVMVATLMAPTAAFAQQAQKACVLNAYKHPSAGYLLIMKANPGDTVVIYSTYESREQLASGKTLDDGTFTYHSGALFSYNDYRAYVVGQVGECEVSQQQVLDLISEDPKSNIDQVCSSFYGVTDNNGGILVQVEMNPNTPYMLFRGGEEIFRGWSDGRGLASYQDNVALRGYNQTYQLELYDGRKCQMMAYSMAEFLQEPPLADNPIEPTPTSEAADSTEASAPDIIGAVLTAWNIDLTGNPFAGVIEWAAAFAVAGVFLFLVGAIWEALKSIWRGLIAFWSWVQDRWEDLLDWWYLSMRPACENAWPYALGAIYLALVWVMFWPSIHLQEVLFVRFVNLVFEYPSVFTILTLGLLTIGVTVIFAVAFLLLRREELEIRAALARSQMALNYAQQTLAQAETSAQRAQERLAMAAFGRVAADVARIKAEEEAAKVWSIAGRMTESAEAAHLRVWLAVKAMLDGDDDPQQNPLYSNQWRHLFE